MKIVLAVCLAGIVASSPALSRDIVHPLVGLTFDNINNVGAKVTALRSSAAFPSLRVVFDKGTSAQSYRSAVSQFYQHAYIMGEVADSSYMQSYTVSGLRSYAQSLVAALGDVVDIWEIGNEVNGDWLGTNVMGKIETAYDVVSSVGGRTALTFFYEGEPDGANCIDSQGGMFPWIQRNFLNSPTVETETIRNNVDYVLISWYPTQCRGVSPDWVMVFNRLGQIFPNSYVGFGELGTPRPQKGSLTERNLINTYYPLSQSLAGLPSSYVGGYFWWYGAQELVPWDRYGLGSLIDGAQ